jgi:ketosteroid isomerase-like protein
MPLRKRVLEFYSAYAKRDFAKVADFLHDDVVWSVSGPVDVLPYCGVRRSKAEALHVLQEAVPKIFRERRFDVEQVVVEGENAAVLAQLTGVKHDGRVTKFRVAHFVAFSGDKIARLTSVIDSFNAVEQTLGIHLSMTDDVPSLQPNSNVVAI